MRPVLRLVALAASVLAPLASADPIRLVTGNDYLPFADENLPEGGAAASIVRQAFKASGREVAIDFLPWIRGYDSVLAHEAAGTFPYAKTEERQEVVAYSEPLYVIRRMVFSARAHPVAFHASGDLAGKRLCSPLGYGLPVEIDQMVKSGTIALASVRRIGNCIKVIEAGRADFMIGDPETVRRAAEEEGAWDKIRMAETPLPNVGLHLVVAKSDPAGPKILEQFNAGLARIKADGSYDAILARFALGPPG